MTPREAAVMRLAYRGKDDHPPEGRFGTYLGGGGGTVDGPLISGEVSWHLYEDQGGAQCEANFIGTIRTVESAVAEFEILGFFSREPATNIWTLWSAIRFKSDDGALASLDGRLGLVQGTFDADTYTHDYRIFAAEPEPT